MVKYNGDCIETSDAFDIMSDMRKRLAKKKVYEFEYAINRYNPQLGFCERVSTVLATSESEAERKAKKSYRDYRAYGTLSFKGLTGNKKLLSVDVDYRWVVGLEDVDFGNQKIVKKLERVYH